MTNCTMDAPTADANSDETPVLLVQSHGHTYYEKISNLLAAFCLFALAMFICGLYIIKKEVQQTIVDEMKIAQKKLFPGKPGGKPGKSDNEDNDSDNGGNSKNEDGTDERPTSGSNANAKQAYADLQKDLQRIGKNGNVTFSGNRTTLGSKGTGKPPQPRHRPPAHTDSKCKICGLFPNAAERERDEIFLINPNASMNITGTNPSSYVAGSSMALSSGTQIVSSNEGTFEIYQMLPSSVYNNVSQSSIREYGLQDPEMVGNDIVSHTMRNGIPQQPDPPQMEEYLSYLGGMVHRQNNEAYNNARITAFNRRNRNNSALWEEVTSSDELHTNVNYFRSARNFP